MTEVYTDLVGDCEMICDEQQPSFISLQSEESEEETMVVSNPLAVTVIERKSASPASTSPRVVESPMNTKPKSFHLHELSRADTEPSIPGRPSSRNSKIPISKLFSSSPRQPFKRKSVSLMDVSAIEPFSELNPVLSWDTIASDGSHGKSKDSGFNCSNSSFSINSSKLSKHEEELNQLNESLKKELEYREVMINTLQESNIELRMKCAEAENKITQLKLKCEKFCSCCCGKNSKKSPRSGPFTLPSSSSVDSSVTEFTADASSTPFSSPPPSLSSAEKVIEKKQPIDQQNIPSFKSTIVDCNLIKNHLQRSRSQGFKDNELRQHLVKQWRERHPNVKFESVFKNANPAYNSSSRVLKESLERASKAERLITDMFKDLKDKSEGPPRSPVSSTSDHYKPWLSPRDPDSGKKVSNGFEKRTELKIVKSNSSIDVIWDNSSDCSTRFKKIKEDNNSNSIPMNLKDTFPISKSIDRNYDLAKSSGNRSVGNMMLPGGSPIVGKYFSLLESPKNYTDFLKLENACAEKTADKVVSVENSTSVLSSFLPASQVNQECSLRQWTELILKDKEPNMSNLTRLTVTRKESHAEQLSRWNELKERLSHLKIPTAQSPDVCGVGMSSRSPLGTSINPSLGNLALGNNIPVCKSGLLSTHLATTSDQPFSSLFADSISSHNESPRSTPSLQEVLKTAEKYAVELSVGLAALPPKLRDIQNIGH